MICMVVGEELKIPVTRAYFQHLPLQLSSLQNCRNTPHTKQESDVKPAPAPTALPDSHHYWVNPHNPKTSAMIWGLSSSFSVTNLIYNHALINAGQQQC